MKRRKTEKPVTRAVRIIVGGKCIRTVKAKLTIAAAVRERGGDPVSTEGRLLCGEPLRLCRGICRGVRVEVVYTCDPRPTPAGEKIRVGLNPELLRGGAGPLL